MGFVFTALLLAPLQVASILASFSYGKSLVSGNETIRNAFAAVFSLSSSFSMLMLFEVMDLIQRGYHLYH